MDALPPAYSPLMRSFCVAALCPSVRVGPRLRPENDMVPTPGMQPGKTPVRWFCRSVREYRLFKVSWARLSLLQLAHISGNKIFGIIILR